MQRSHINKFSQIQFYVPSSVIPHPSNPFPYIYPGLLFEWISQLIKLFISVACLLMNYTFYFSFRSLVVSLEMTIDGPLGISVCLTDNDELISSVKDKKKQYFRGWSRVHFLLSMESLLPQVR